jgi:hypothetical protein
VCFLDGNHSGCVRWKIKVVLIFVLLMTKDVEHFLCICISSFEYCLVNSFAHLLIGLFILLVLNFFSFYENIFDINTMLDGCLAKIFSKV